MNLNKFSKVIFIFSFFVLIAISQNAFAFMYKIDDYYPNRSTSSPYWNGGPFTVTVLDGLKPLRSFITYCLERDEYLDFYNKFYGTIEPYAIKGGTKTNKGGDEPGSSITKDYLNPWSEWLYANYLDDSLRSTTKMQGFQIALWYIEGEWDPSKDGPLSDQALFYYDKAKNANPTAQDIPWISVLNLSIYDSNRNNVDKQSLIFVPEPGILILLGIAFSAIGLAARRRKF